MEQKMVKLGPVPLPPKTLGHLMGTISRRNQHTDLVFTCDGAGPEKSGVVLAHKFYIGAQSKYLKSVINSVSGSEKEMTEIKIPGVNISHLKKAIKFMYTGKLNISMREIKNDHLVWHINNILVNIFKIDAKLNLPAHLLIPPPMPDDTDDDNPPGDEPRDCEDGVNNTKQNLATNGHGGSDTYQSNSNPASDIQNTRQNKQMKEEQIDDEKPKIKVEDITGEPEEFVRNVATPDIIDLLDSDDEDCDNNNYFEGGNLDEESNEHPEDDVDQNVDLNKNSENQCKESDQSLEYSPRSKGVKRAHFEAEEERNSDDYSHEPVPAPSLSAARRKSREDTFSKAAVTHVPVSSILSAPSPLESPAVRHAHKDQDAALYPPPKKRIHEDPLESPVSTPKAKGGVKAKSVVEVSSPRTMSRSGRNNSPRIDYKTGMRVEDTSTSSSTSILSAPGLLESPAVRHAHKDQDSALYSPPKKRLYEEPLESSLLTNDLLQTAMDAIYIPTTPGPSSAQQPLKIIVPAAVIARKSVPPLIPVLSLPSPPIPVQKNVTVVKPPASNASKGVRSHHHSPWTVSGLKRPETIADLSQPKVQIHECQVCGAKFDHLKSLTIHIGRYHNHKSMVPCPEGCGKMLTTQAAIRKHLLSHRPEEEWPHKCPLCPKKFQARGDIPKHLKTKIHEADNVPDMGTRAWFDLIYHDDPTYVYENKMQEFNKKKARGKMC